MEGEARQPEQVENPQLVAAIAQLAKKQNDRNWRRFYKQLVKSNFWLVVAKPVDEITEGEVPREKGLQAGFVALRNEAGHVTVPAFTDVHTLRSWAPPGHPWMVVPALVLLREMVKNPAAHLEINRRSEGQWGVTHDEIVVLARGEVPQGEVRRPAVPPEVLAELLRSLNTSIKPLPGNWPAELIAVLRNALVVQRPVVDAYAFELMADSSRYAVVGLRFTEKPEPALFTETTDMLRVLANGLLPSGQSLEFMALNERDVLARVVESVEPFFARR